LCAARPYECFWWSSSSAQARIWTGWLYWFNSSKRNTLRHCVWQCLLTYRIGWKSAADWAVAHEAGSTSKDTKVDYHNNLMGRVIGTHLDEMTYPSLVGKAVILCDSSWDAGYLWYLDDLKRPRWSDGRLISTYRFNEPGPNNP